MIIKSSSETDIPALRQLWKQAFGDPDSLLDGFFSTAYAPERSLCAWEDRQLVGMVYWFPHSWQRRKVAYAYAVATDQNYRNRGVCHQLMAALRDRLQGLGYYGILLVPADAGLAEFYRRMGYRDACGMRSLMRPAAPAPGEKVQKITWREYERLRMERLPEGSLIPGPEVYRYLNTYLGFYRWDAGILCAAREVADQERVLRVQEFFGDAEQLPAVAAAMGCRTVSFRLPGEASFGMFIHLTEETEMPKYFGLPMD